MYGNMGGNTVTTSCLPSSAKTAEKRTAVYSSPTTSPSDKSSTHGKGRWRAKYGTEWSNSSLWRDFTLFIPRGQRIRLFHWWSSMFSLDHCGSILSTQYCRNNWRTNAVSRTTTSSPTEDQPLEEMKKNVYTSQEDIDSTIIHCPLATLKKVAPAVFQLIVEHPWDNMTHHE